MVQADRLLIVTLVALLASIAVTLPVRAEYITNFQYYTLPDFARVATESEMLLTGKRAAGVATSQLAYFAIHHASGYLFVPGAAPTPDEVVGRYVLQATGGTCGAGTVYEGDLTWNFFGCGTPAFLGAGQSRVGWLLLNGLPFITCLDVIHNSQGTDFSDGFETFPEPKGVAGVDHYDVRVSLETGSAAAFEALCSSGSTITPGTVWLKLTLFRTGQTSGAVLQSNPTVSGTYSSTLQVGFPFDQTTITEKYQVR